MQIDTDKLSALLTAIELATNVSASVRKALGMIFSMGSPYSDHGIGTVRTIDKLDQDILTMTTIAVAMRDAGVEGNSQDA